MNKSVSFTDYACGTCLPNCPDLAINPENDNDVAIRWHKAIVNFFDDSLVAGPSFMSISLLVLELWKFSFVRDWPEIRKSERPSSEFCPISGDWGKLQIPNLAWMSLMKCYYMLQNVKIVAFTAYQLLKETQQGEESKC